jgi:cysteinyl-tRNA synthetase
MLKLRNTLTRQLEEFKPIEDGIVRMYVCGPTVYDYGHIGNFRTFVAVDLLRRYLTYRGYTVHHVMNVTDVDDKIIREITSAGRELKEYTGFYLEEFLRDADGLRIERPETMPRATDHIPEMVDLVEALKRSGHTYQSDGSLYFSIASFPSYGRLSGLKVQGNLAGARVDVDEYEKADARDFVLWKAPKDEKEPHWETPFGPGRPGWHLECSAMSMKYLGQSFDIHCGGVDLIFPHHENEIAQSEAATGREFVRYWFHVEFLLVEGEKMSKSKGNILTVNRLVEQGYSPDAIRYLLLRVPYGTQLNFTLDGLREAESALERLRNFRRRLSGTGAQPGSHSVAAEIIDRARKGFEAGLDNDLNTSEALAAVFELVRDLNTALDAGECLAEDCRAALAFLEQVDSVLAVMGPHEDELPEPEIQALIDERYAARRSRNFARADQIRDDLASRGIILEDTPEGTRWKRKGR